MNVPERAPGWAPRAPARWPFAAPWPQQFQPMSLDWPRAGQARQYTAVATVRPLSPGFTHMPGFGAAKKKKKAKGGGKGPCPCDAGVKSDRLAKREKAQAGAQLAAKGAYTSASVALAFPPPYSLVAAAAGALTGAAIQLGAAIQRGDTLALAGDKRAIAGWIKKMSRWSPAKRKREAARLNHALEKLVAQCKATWTKRGKVPDALLVRIAKTRLKAAAIVAVFERSRKSNPKKPLVHGDPGTADAYTSKSAAANADSPSDDAPPVPEAAGAAKVFGIIPRPAVPVIAIGAGLLLLVGAFALATRR